MVKCNDESATLYRPVAQLEERASYKGEADGSIPSGLIRRSVAQAGQRTRFGPGGPEVRILPLRYKRQISR